MIYKQKNRETNKEKGTNTYTNEQVIHFIKLYIRNVQKKKKIQFHLFEFSYFAPPSRIWIIATHTAYALLVR